MEHSFYLLQDLALIVICSTAFTWLFSALRLPILLGFITVGILLSPILGILHSTDSIVELGELGVLFMMFFVGMEFNPDRLKKVFAPSFLGISAQIIAMGVLGMIAARIMGMTSIDGIFLGGVLAMSSTVVIMEIFEQRGVLNKTYAQIAVGILIIEDLFAIFLLVVLSSLAQKSGVDFGRLGESVLVLTTFVVTIYVVGKLLVSYLVKRFTALENSQAMIMFVFCAVLGLSQLAHLSGLSQPLGAFLAGSILSGTKIATRIEHLTSPFRNLFVALFFVSVGTMIQPNLIIELWVPILVISLCVVVFQTAACFTGIVIGGASARDGYFGAINKAQIGEFSFVIASLGLSLGVMNPKIMAIAMGVSFLTVFVNPFLSSKARKVTDFFGTKSPLAVRNIFDSYKLMITRIGGSSSGNARLKRIIPPALGGFVYLFIFNAIMILTVLIFDVLGNYPMNFKYASMTVWAINTVVSLPLLIGLLVNLELLFIGFFNIKKRQLSRWGARIFRFASASLFALMITAAYFAILSHYFPSARAIYYHLILVFALLMICGPLLRRVNLKIESKFSEIFQRHLANADHHKHELMLKKIRDDYAWAPEIKEVKIPANAVVSGKTMRQIAIRENFGCDVVAIKRGEFVMYDVMAETHVFPSDILILSGNAEENRKARAMLSKVSETEDESEKSDLCIEVLTVSADSPLVGKTLSELQITKTYFVKVLAICNNDDKNFSRPDIREPINQSNAMMFLGPQEHLARLKIDFKLIN